MSGIRRLTNRDAEFYALVGPFLARRDIFKERGGGVLWDDDGKVWWVESEGGAVRGLLSMRLSNRAVHLESAYVVPAFRRQGVYRRLFEARWLEALSYRLPVTATVVDPVLPVCLEHGFTVRRRNGRYTVVDHPGGAV